MFSEDKAFLKLECFQPVRSFKIRGASNKILSIPEDERKRTGVITASSGNHGLAVAYVSKLLGIASTIVLPQTVVEDKLEWIKTLGARTVLFGRQQDERKRKAEEIAAAEGQTFVQPFDDLEVITGQATCGLEISQDSPDLESVFVPIGGGGLISGIASFMKMNEKTKHVKVIGVQPEGSPSMFESWKNQLLGSIKESASIADGLCVRRPGEITFSFVRRFVDEIILVSDDEILSATFRLLRKEHVLAEPSGAAALAGFLKIKEKGLAAGNSVVVVSGGNISEKLLREVISRNQN
jgi:threonine dehydratase